MFIYSLEIQAIKPFQKACNSLQAAQRKNTITAKAPGAFWEDRYHATAIDIESHLFRCFIYIDLNRVRNKALTHPSLWQYGGYHEIQYPQQRYRIINQEALLDLTGIASYSEYQIMHRQGINEAIKERQFLSRQANFSEALAVGNEAFVTKFKSAMDIAHHQRKISKTSDDGYYIKEPNAVYDTHFGAEKGVLS